MVNLTRSLRVTAFASLTALIVSSSWAGELETQSPAQTEPEYFDGAFVGDSPASASFELGYDLGTAFSGVDAESAPDYGIGESLARLSPPDSAATDNKGTVLVPWTSSSDLAPRPGRVGGLAALIKSAREHYLAQGGTVGDDGVMRLDMTLDQVLTGLTWRKNVVENLKQGE